MKRYYIVILVLCVSIVLSGCKTIEESTISSEPSTILSENTETDASVSSNTSSETIPSTSSETEAPVTYESVSAPEGLTREEIYDDVGQELLIPWSKYFYIDNDSHTYLREYSEFNETMMLEILYTSYLYGPADLNGNRPEIFDYCHYEDNVSMLLYTVQACIFYLAKK